MACQEDARYEKMRVEHWVVDMAGLVAIGVNAEGRRDVLGVEVPRGSRSRPGAPSPKGLVERGLSGVRLVVSDAQAEHLALAEWDSAASRKTERSPGEAA
jgi:putative transposase